MVDRMLHSCQQRVLGQSMNKEEEEEEDQSINQTHFPGHPLPRTPTGPGHSLAPDTYCQPHNLACRNGLRLEISTTDHLETTESCHTDQNELVQFALHGRIPTLSFL